MNNHLKDQRSPYLLQHSQNPVDWYPWCTKAFEKAKKEDKPIFLSIGYSTCHWCHVMAHESFENKEIAEILNKYFVSMKVDREERPDIDSVYMTFCQAFTGRGGWPMSIFMTAEQKPFFAGTYFPVESHSGMIGFRDLLLTIAKKWKSDKIRLVKTADDMVTGYHAAINQKKENSQPEYFQKAGEFYNDFHTNNNNVKSQIDENLPKLAAELFSESFDERYGGFGTAPKFPTPHNLIFLTLYSQMNHDKISMKQVQITLDKMRRGGIFDHIGYGFSRYSTDPYFLVPHFEKMLYDNALLILAYSIAYQETGDKSFLDTAQKTAEYVLREMTGADGEFYSAQDADSEGEEGKFYVWSYDEICNMLGEEKGKEFCAYYGVTKQGNFEGKNILNLLNGKDISDKFHREIELLYQYRQSRAKLHLDDKILTSWNSLMICAMSMLYKVTGNRRYLDRAKNAYDFIEKSLVRGNILYVSCRDSVQSVKGFLEEYAYYTGALISLYEVTCDNVYLERARQICKEAQQQFADERNGGYFLYGTQNDSLITKPKETYDGALPSGNSVMAYCLVRLSQLTDSGEFTQMAEKQLAFLSAEAKDYPAGHSMFLTALLLYLNPPQKVTVVLSSDDSVEKIMCSLPVYADIKILTNATPEYKLLNDRTTYYVCKDHMCFPPTNRI